MATDWIEKLREDLERGLRGDPSPYPDPWHTFDPDIMTVFGCYTGISIDHLADQPFELLPGLMVGPLFADIFSAVSLSTTPPVKPGALHGGVWTAVRGGFLYEARVQITLSPAGSFANSSASEVHKLVAFVLRLQVPAPVRLLAIGNMPFAEMENHRREAAVGLVESSPSHFGRFATSSHPLDTDDLGWLLRAIPAAIKMTSDNRFNKAMTIFEQSHWCNTAESATMLIWTALETFFNLGSEMNKTKALSRAVADYVSVARPDRDKAYQIVQRVYGSRGRVVHAGSTMPLDDFLQSYRFAQVVFRRALLDEHMP